MLIGRDLARAFDPCILAQACGIEPDAWQADFLRSDSKRQLQLAARQVGKTTSCCLKSLHTALYEPGSLILAVAPAERQSKEFVRGCRLLHKTLPDAPPLKGDSVTKIEFENESRIWALPGDNDGRGIRGISAPRLVIIDEASLVSDELVAAVLPMLSTRDDAELVAITTPARKAGWFYDQWTSNDPLWKRVTITVDMCPRISPAFLDEARRTLGQTAFETEYGLRWAEDSSAAFPQHIIDGIFSRELRALWT